MKRMILFLLVAAALIDIAQQAYTSDLVDSIQKSGDLGSSIHAILTSSIMATIGRWGLFLIGFGVLSLTLAGKKSARANSLHNPRS